MPAAAPLDADAVRRRVVLPGGRWTSLRWVASTGSTNVDLVAAARADLAVPGTVLIAEEQTAGRGRFARQWSSPPGASLAVSVLLRPAVPPQRWGWLSLLAGLSVARALGGLGVSADLKWPNDVLVDGRKLCGILSELVVTDAGPLVVVGMGVNVAQAAEELPVPTATSLHLQGCPVGKDEVAIAILGRLERCLADWEAGLPVEAEYRSRCTSIGRPVRLLQEGAEAIEGTGLDVDGDGRLVVGTGSTVSAFAAGDVVHLR